MIPRLGVEIYGTPMIYVIEHTLYNRIENGLFLCFQLYHCLFEERDTGWWAGSPS